MSPKQPTAENTPVQDVSGRPVPVQDVPARDAPIEDGAVEDTVQVPALGEDERFQEQDDWLQEPEELPRRPRRRLLGVGGNPIALSLLGVLLVACGFIGGVLVEKGQSSSSSPTSASSSLASRFAALRGGSSGASSSGASSSGASSSGASGAGASALALAALQARSPARAVARPPARWRSCPAARCT